MRRALSLVFACSTSIAMVVVACTSGDAQDVPIVESDGGIGAPSPTPNGGDDDGGGGAVKGDPPTGLPCDVQAMLENRCTVCHSNEAPRGPLLVTFDDLKAPSTREPTKSRAELSLQLMKDKAMPQPPAEPASDEEIADLEAWLKAGMPHNAESCVQGTPDGGAGDAGPPPSLVDAGGCTSGKDAGPGDGPLMRPGEACIACHTVQRGPRFTFAGTVFPTFHDPNGCVGAAPPMSVTITDARGRTEVMQINEAGNFSSTRRLNAPYRVVVTSPKGTRAMQRTINGGDCNGCHTQWGDAGAPGRVVAP